MRSLGALVGALIMIPLAGSVVDRAGSGTKFPDSPRPQDPFARRLDEALRLHQNGRLRDSLTHYEAIRAEAAGRNALVEARAISGLGTSRIVSGEYDSAARSLLDAKQRLRALGAIDLARTVELNLASLYKQIGDVSAAEQLYRANLPHAEQNQSANLAGILLELAPIEAKRHGIDSALPLFRRGLDAAARLSTPRTAILGLDRLAHALAAAGRRDHAERVMLEAFSMRRAAGLSEAISLMDLASLEDLRGNRRTALALHDRAIAELARNPVGRFSWTFYQARAASREAAGDRAGALADLRVAMELVANRRGALPPADSLRIGFEGLVDSAYEQFVATALRDLGASARPELINETFEAIEANRAASLAAHLNGSQQWRESLPPSYWDDAKALTTAEAAYLARPGLPTIETMRPLRRRLLDAEAAAGSPVPAAASLLEGMRRRLGPDELYLSFHVTPSSTWRWTVTRDSVTLRELGGDALAARIAAFRKAISGGDATPREGRELFELLFGGLGKSDRSHWLWSANAVLFDLPVAALVTSVDGGRPRWLAEERTVTLTPGAAALLTRRAERPAITQWAAVADPIYNAADNRSSPAPPFVLRARPSTELARLPGSGAEIRAIASAWPDAGRSLEGQAVTVDRVRLLAESAASILHLATHVIPPNGDYGDREGARIALGLGSGWQQNELTPATIWRWKVRASLVALSGCASGTGASLPGTGLIGLTRAWLMAGARDVLATHWPVPDDGSHFFSEFYRQLRTGISPAAALRRTQTAMIASAGPRADPRYWAAYFVTGI